MERAACLIASADVPVAGAALQAFISHEDLKLSALDILTTSKASSTKYSTLLVIGQSLGRELLAAVASLLLPGAKLYVYQPAVAAGGGMEVVSTELLLAGFTDVVAVVITQGANSINLVHAKKPQWELGAKVSLSLKSRPATSAAAGTTAAAAATPAPPAAPPAAAPAAKKWQVSADDEDGEDGADLMDEDELLTEEDKTRPAPVAAASDDCEVGSSGRKACANCSCGRAEAEAAGVKVELTQDMLDNPVSACGSCSLGDAFRCGGCPYRGLPAFEPGQKITLGANFLTADA